MPEGKSEAVLDWQGPLSPPRRNGELVFDALWESRLFGMTMTLYEAGCFGWPDFRDRLIEAIGEWERAHGTSGDGFDYWERWLVAFERLVVAKGLCASDELAARFTAFAARPAGHDH